MTTATDMKILVLSLAALLSAIAIAASAPDQTVMAAGNEALPLDRAFAR